MKTTMILMSSLLVLAVGCTDDEEVGDSTLNLSFTNLPELGADHVYEGWLVTPDGPVSSGRFVVDSTGALSPSTFSIDHETGDATTLFILTIEPATGDDPAPSAVHLVAGAFNGEDATLSTSHEAALATDFADAAGDYILATPSTSGDMTDESQGIWWLAPATMTASLTLPALPEGWIYEGWVVGADGPVSTGTFSAGDMEDSDGAGIAAGTDGSPPFPGADFIDPSMDLLGGAAVISVEPVPDDSPMPFIIKPLVDSDVEDIAPPAGQAMANNAAATLPSGTASLLSHHE